MWHSCTYSPSCLFSARNGLTWLQPAGAHLDGQQPLPLGGDRAQEVVGAVELLERLGPEAAHAAVGVERVHRALAGRCQLCEQCSSVPSTPAAYVGPCGATTSRHMQG